MSVKVTMIPGWDTKIERGLKVGLLELITDVQRRSVVLAPRLTGALASSAIIGTVMNGYSLTYGSSRVPYARRRHFENRKNPQTIGYLSRAAEGVARGNIAKYFKVKV